MNDTISADPRRDPRLAAIPDVHGHPKGEHRPYAEERPIPYTARMLFLWFYHACLRGFPRFMMVSDHINFLTFEDPAAINLVRRALKLAEAGDLYGASETAEVDLAHATVVSEGLRRGMRFSIGAEVDADPRSRPDAQNIVEALRPDAMIRSVHFLTIDHPEHGHNWQWPFDNPEFIGVFAYLGPEKTWELYMAAVLEAVEKLPGHILGHFYAPAKFGHWPDDALLETYEDRVLEACAQRGMAVEINTRLFYRSDDEALKRKYREVNLRLMRKAKALNVGICIASDAHSPKNQGGGFEEALSMLDEAEINELIFPVNGRMARVALRATKEHLERKAVHVPIPVPTTHLTLSAIAITTVQAHTEDDGSDAEAPPPTAIHGTPPSSVTKGKSGKKSAQKQNISVQTSAKAHVKKTLVKKAPAKKTTAKKAPVKKAPAKKTLVKKAPAKKTTAKKAPVKKAPAKKTLVKKASAKKTTAKKALVKKTPAKKISAKKKTTKPRR
jgi:HisJ family histidinol phosphate phosphatase